MYLNVNGYDLSISEQSIFTDPLLQQRLNGDIYQAFQLLKQYIPKRQIRLCLEMIANTEPNNKIKALQSNIFARNRVSTRLNNFCDALIFELNLCRRNAEENEKDMSKGSIEFAIKTAWESATYHIIRG